MRSLRYSATASLGLFASLLLAGCNAIFGLDAVEQRDGNCSSDVVKDNLLVNASFEENSAWTTAGEVEFDYAPAEDCSFACGSQVGHLAVKAGGAIGSIGLSQEVDHPIELGGKFTLSARYRYTAPTPPYFALNINGFTLGTRVKGTKDGQHFVINNVEVPVNDARRTGDRVQAGLFADYDAKGLDASVDCLALTYTPPPGLQVLQNIRFDTTASDWGTYNGATLKWDEQGGLCGSGAGHVAVPANEANAEIRSAVEGKWPAKTKFSFGGALKPIKDINGVLASLKLSMTLFIEYEDDKNPGTEEIASLAPALAELSDEDWKRVSGEFTADRPVAYVGLLIGGGSKGAPGDFLADCVSLRAIPPPTSP